MTDLSDEIQEINLEGFQVVSGDLFTNYTRTSNPTVTLWHSSISFSKASLTLLNGCERIRVEINPNSTCLLIVPVTIKDKDNIHWVKGIKDPVPRKMECKRFTSHLYKTWSLDPEFVYRTIGRVVTAKNKVMILFDFNKAESWKQSSKARSRKNE